MPCLATVVNKICQMLFCFFEFTPYLNVVYLCNHIWCLNALNVYFCPQKAFNEAIY